MTEPSWEVLNTKVEFQGQQIDKLAEDTAKQFVDFREDTGKQLSSLRSDVKGEFGTLRGSLDALATTIANNNSDREKSNRGSWISLLGTGLTAVVVASGLLGTLATLRLTPIENDVKGLKDGQALSTTALEKIIVKLDNFETRAELQEHNKLVENDIGVNRAAIGKLGEDKVSKSDLDSITRERNAQVARLQDDIKDQKAINTAQAEAIVNVRIAQAKVDVLQSERGKILDQIYVELGKRATTEALDGLRLRLTDQRDRTNVLSSRVQDLSLKAGVVPTEKTEMPAEGRTR